MHKRLFLQLAVAAMLMLSVPAATGLVFFSASAAPACAVLSAAKVTASGNDGRNVPNNAIDGKLGTRWSSLGKGSWISIDLGSPKTICYVDVAWYRGNARQYTFTISHSLDDKTYTQTFSGKSSGNTNGFERYDFADFDARYVKITVNGNTENHWASINEIRVFGYTGGSSGVQDTTKPSVTIDQPANNSEIKTASSTATTKVSQPATSTLPPIIPGPSPSPLKDRFGIAEVVPTMPGGRVWTSTWDNGVSRTFGNSNNDPSDPQFITSKNGGGLGDGSYRTSGDGILKISGQFPRMYIVDPARDWHNVEITVYGMRVDDTNIAWAGLQAHVRTAQGILGDEDVNICDDRAYSAQLTYPGEALFEKKTNHHTDNGYAQVNGKTVFPGGMPKNVWIGYKFIVRDTSAGQVKLEMYMDMTNGLNGGTWIKVSEFTDTGRNFGAGFDSCRSGINPALPLTVSNVRAGSETGRPNVAVYFRSDGVNTDGLLYKEASIREIASLP